MEDWEATLFSKVWFALYWRSLTGNPEVWQPWEIFSWATPKWIWSARLELVSAFLQETKSFSKNLAWSSKGCSPTSQNYFQWACQTHFSLSCPMRFWTKTFFWLTPCVSGIRMLPDEDCHWPLTRPIAWNPLMSSVAGLASVGWALHSKCLRRSSSLEEQDTFHCLTLQMRITKVKRIKEMELLMGVGCTKQMKYWKLSSGTLAAPFQGDLDIQWRQSQCDMNAVALKCCRWLARFWKRQAMWPTSLLGLMGMFSIFFPSAEFGITLNPFIWTCNLKPPGNKLRGDCESSFSWCMGVKNKIQVYKGISINLSWQSTRLVWHIGI